MISVTATVLHYPADSASIGGNPNQVKSFFATINNLKLPFNVTLTPLR